MLSPQACTTAQQWRPQTSGPQNATVLSLHVDQVIPDWHRIRREASRSCNEPVVQTRPIEAALICETACSSNSWICEGCSACQRERGTASASKEFCAGTRLPVQRTGCPPRYLPTAPPHSRLHGRLRAAWTGSRCLKISGIFRSTLTDRRRKFLHRRRVLAEGRREQTKAVSLNEETACDGKTMEVYRPMHDILSMHCAGFGSRRSRFFSATSLRLQNGCSPSRPKYRICGLKRQWSSGSISRADSVANSMA